MKSNIEILLGEWGAWKRGENRTGLGYPDRTSFQGMRVDGVQRVDPYALMVDDDLKRLDEYVEVLFPEMRAILMAHYIWAGPVRIKLGRLRMLKTRYYEALEVAHNQLSYWMGGRYDDRTSVGF